MGGGLVLLLQPRHLLRGVPLQVALALLEATAELPDLRRVLLSHQLRLGIGEGWRWVLGTTPSTLGTTP